MRSLIVLALVQAVLGARVFARLARTARAAPIRPGGTVAGGSVSAIVPVLDEAARLGPCLEGLCASGPELREILVVDGGSIDATGAVIAEAARRDPRVRYVGAAPVPAGWNGKAWGLEVGLAASSAASTWVMTIDADVRPRAALPAALVAHGQRERLGALSVATRQELADAVQGLLHPALLATLVYRYGAPGAIATRPAAVQANGQCFLARRSALLRTGAFARARASRCEDVTAARVLAAAGERVGFFESADLVRVRMHDDWRATWRDWPRSLPLLDEFTRAGAPLALAEVLLVQALPLPLAVALLARGAFGFALAVNVALAVARGGVLAGTRRAYAAPPPTYWLSPLADLPALAALVASAVRRRHTWRGRVLVAERAA